MFGSARKKFVFRCIFVFLVVCVHIKRCKVDFLCFSYGDHYRGLENYLTFHSDGGEPKLISRTVVCVSSDVEKSRCWWEAQLGERKLVTGCAELRAKRNWFTELYCEGGTGPCHCMHIYILYFIF